MSPLCPAHGFNSNILLPTKPTIFLPQTSKTSSSECPFLNSTAGFKHNSSSSTSFSTIPTPHMNEVDDFSDDAASKSLHRALRSLKFADHYAEKTYPTAFNWDQLELDEDVDGEWYCVVFRSIRKQDSNSNDLYEADALAHAEALQAGGLLMYFYGVPDRTTGLNLATCVWKSRQHAIDAARLPSHGEAMRLAATSYQKYDLERWVLRKAVGESGVTLAEWEGGNVGKHLSYN